ncbi:MAG: tol-pal system protein YbgF [Rhodocyclaceae bacterium]|jgi:tol-pal system protein YbgF|nr:tol-pal system protein YbgF [Rhodocyclaceae bacterium]
MNLRPLLLAGTLLALPVRAALFEDDGARQQIKQVRAELAQTIDTLTQRVESASRNQLDFANQMESLRAEVARLRGQVEVLMNAVETAQKRQQDFYVDLDNRLRKLETVAAPPADPAAPAPAKSDPQTEMRDYEAALGQFRESRFKEAQAAFEAFIAGHAQSAMLPNAHYWLGSSLHQQKQYAQAAQAFGHVAATWPNDAKAPDALLAQANALVGAKDVDGAVKVLQTLVEKYPTSPAVETARARIKTLAPKKKR